MTLKTALLSTILLTTSTFSGLALAADVEAGVVKSVVNISEYDSFAADYPIDYSLMNNQINSKKEIYSKLISTAISFKHHTKSPTETENICGTLNVDVHIIFRVHLYSTQI